MTETKRENEANVETNQATTRTVLCDACGIVMNEPLVNYFTCPRCGGDKHVPSAPEG